jgi:hypothetical protein
MEHVFEHVIVNGRPLVVLIVAPSLIIVLILNDRVPAMEKLHKLVLQSIS